MCAEDCKSPKSSFKLIGLATNPFRDVGESSRDVRKGLRVDDVPVKKIELVLSHDVLKHSFLSTTTLLVNAYQLTENSLFREIMTGSVDQDTPDWIFRPIVDYCCF